ncbi:MAG: ATP-binding cassette domain-containing protein [Deltaproteobacteria bacterium]|nr:ATP-binding cassette domain-containing protein [Deltaproteobacteria bacterium]
MITVERVRKSFAETTILDGIDLQVREGEVLVLLGPSGAGKSLLLYLIAGLVKPESGRIELGSRRIGMLFQKNALFDSMSVGENLAFPLKELTPLRKEEIEERVRGNLAAFGLAQWYPAPVNALSGGMQKRLALARALIANPDIILCDSPTAGLDPITARQMTDLMAKECAKLNRATIIASHDIPRSLSLAHRVALLSEGRITFSGTPDEFLRGHHPAIDLFLNRDWKEPFPKENPNDRHHIS